MIDEPDVLASLVRTAIARRNLDSLPPLLGDWSSVDALDVAHLEPARVGDGGRQPNPLWASTTSVREAAAIERLGLRLTGKLERPTKKAPSKTRK